MRAAINPVSGEGGPTIQTEYPEPPPWDPVSADSLALEIGLIHAFFRDKLISVEGLYLIEDENLPIKQRLAKPRLPPTGKINTPRKRKDAPGHGGSSKKKKKPVVAAPVVKPEVVLITPPPDKEDDASENESLFVEGD
jgi:transcriptional activator SPT7